MQLLFSQQSIYITCSSLELFHQKLNGTHFVYSLTSHLDKHNRLTGLNIEKDRIELWEESKDGSGKLCD